MIFPVFLPPYSRFKARGKSVQLDPMAIPRFLALLSPGNQGAAGKGVDFEWPNKTAVKGKQTQTKMVSILMILGSHGSDRSPMQPLGRTGKKPGSVSFKGFFVSGGLSP